MLERERREDQADRLAILPTAGGLADAVASSVLPVES
jgi:hypothetical protein